MNAVLTWWLLLSRKKKWFGHLTDKHFALKYIHFPMCNNSIFLVCTCHLTVNPGVQVRESWSSVLQYGHPHRSQQKWQLRASEPAVSPTAQPSKCRNQSKRSICLVSILSIIRTGIGSSTCWSIAQCACTFLRSASVRISLSPAPECPCIHIHD